MLTREKDVNAHALRKQGWTISAIARHLGGLSHFGRDSCRVGEGVQ